MLLDDVLLDVYRFLRQLGGGAVLAAKRVEYVQKPHREGRA